MAFPLSTATRQVNLGIGRPYIIGHQAIDPIDVLPPKPLPGQQSHRGRANHMLRRIDELKKYLSS